MSFAAQSMNQSTKKVGSGRLVHGTRRHCSLSQQNIGRQVSIMRQRLGIGRRELAAILKLPYKLMIRIEAGQLSPDDDCYHQIIEFFRFEFESLGE